MSNNTDSANPNPWTPWVLLVVFAIVVLFILGGTRSCTSNDASSARPDQVVVTVTVTRSIPAPAAPTGRSDLGGPLIPGLTAGGAALGPADLGDHAGPAVVAAAVPVQAVPALNGFWIGTSTTNRIWVQLRQRGQVYPHAVRVGDRLSFVGQVVANPAGFADDVGVEPTQGAAQLTDEGWHVETDKTGLTFS